MFKWLHHLLNPHCPDCLAEALANKEAQHCHSCVMLNEEINFLRGQIQSLQNHILNPPVQTEIKVDTENLTPINYSKPWNVKRRELELADKMERQKKDEELRNQAAKPDTAIKSPVVDDEGRIDPNKVEQELEALDKEIQEVTNDKEGTHG